MRKDDKPDPDMDRRICERLERERQRLEAAKRAAADAKKAAEASRRKPRGK